MRRSVRNDAIRLVWTVVFGFCSLVGFCILVSADTILQGLVGLVILLGCLQIILLNSIAGRLDRK